MATFDLANEVNLAKEIIQKVVYKNVLANHKIFQHFLKENVTKSRRYRQSFNADHYIIPTYTQFPANSRPTAEGGTLPAAGRASPVRMSTTLRKVAGTANVSWELTQNATTEAHVINELENIQKLISTDMKATLNALIHGCPSGNNGVLGKVFAIDSETIDLYRHDGTISNHANSEPGTRFLNRPGMPIKATPDGTTIRSTSTTIASITTFQRLVLTAAISGLAQGDYLVQGDANDNAWGISPVSIAEHVNNADVTYQGLATRNTSYPTLTGNVLDIESGSVSQAMTQDVFWQAMDRPLEKTDGDANTTLIIMPPSLRRTYTDLFDQLVRFSPDQGARAVAHTKSVVPNQTGKLIKPLIDPKALPGRITCLDMESFRVLHTGHLLKWHEIDGKILMYIGSNAGSDIYTAVNRAYFQIACECPALNTIIKGIADAPVTGLV